MLHPACNPSSSPLPIPPCPPQRLSFMQAASTYDIVSALTLPLLCNPLVPQVFRCPLSPFLPSLGMLATLHLIGSLGWPAYVRWIVWFTIGTTVYLCYGMHRSQVRLDRGTAAADTRDWREWGRYALRRDQMRSRVWRWDLRHDTGDLVGIQRYRLYPSVRQPPPPHPAVTHKC